MGRAPPPSLGLGCLPASTVWWACLHSVRFLRRARTCSQQSWHSLEQSRRKTPWAYKAEGKQQTACTHHVHNRQHAHTMHTIDSMHTPCAHLTWVRASKAKTLFRIQSVADCFSSCPRVLMHRGWCCAFVQSIKRCTEQQILTAPFCGTVFLTSSLLHHAPRL